MKWIVRELDGKLEVMPSLNLKVKGNILGVFSNKFLANKAKESIVLPEVKVESDEVTEIPIETEEVEVEVPDVPEVPEVPEVAEQHKKTRRRRSH